MWPGVFLALAAVAVLIPAPPAHAGDHKPAGEAVHAEADGPDAGRVIRASYSRGAGGRTLKWLPVRPIHSGRHVDQEVETAVYHEGAAGQATASGSVEQDPSSVTSPVADAPALLFPGPSRLLQWEVPEPKGLPSTAQVEAATEKSTEQIEAESSVESQRIGPKELEETLAVRPERAPEECPAPEDLKTIRQVRFDITPPDIKLPKECTLEADEFQPRAWAPLTFTWKASALCHKPVYFEDVHLERYGHSWGPIPQPLMSAAHFFLNVPVLPYAMGLCTPNECVYTLGYYRPGSCAPYLIDPLPLSVRAGLFQAGAWVGGVFALP
ncbi:MAG TPA: hypothetical protein EYH34_07460 [Planctomycetes bacterium]|nr:hypothetical protein [Planctomycetota bacterium]